jgi:hypothetical protein
MNLKTFQLCDDWGWFIDVEHDNYDENILLQTCRPPIKKFNSYINKLPIIQEDEYEYYEKNHRDHEEIIYKDVEQNYDINLKPSKEDTKKVNTVFNVGSTTLITAILTYFIFVIL